MFSIKDMGNLSYFLGIEAIYTNKGMHLMQRKYVTDLLTRNNMLTANQFRHLVDVLAGKSVFTTSSLLLR